MGLKEVYATRMAQRIVTRDVPGVGPVRFKRLEWPEMRAMPNTAGETIAAATVLQDDKDELFFSGPEAVIKDWGLGVALANEAMKVNGLDLPEPEAAEGK